MSRLDGYRVLHPDTGADRASRPRAGRCGRRCRASASQLRQSSARRNRQGAGAPRRRCCSAIYLRRPDLRLGVHRAFRSPAPLRPMQAVEGATQTLIAAPGRLVDHGWSATCRWRPCACSPAPGAQEIALPGAGRAIVPEQGSARGEHVCMHRSSAARAAFARRRKGAYGWLIALAVAATLALGAALMPASPWWRRPRALPDFTDLVEQVGPVGGQHPHHRAGARSAAAWPRADGRGDAGVLPPVLRPADARRAAPGAAPEPAAGSRRAAAARRRLRLHPHRRWLRDDQRARGRRRRRGARHADRQARVQGQDHRRRQAHRRRGGEDRGHRPAGREGRRHQPAEGRRMGDGDRLAVRPGEHRHRRHRQRQAARHRATTCPSSRPTWRSTRATRAAR